MNDQIDLESVVKQRLDEIKPVAPRNPKLASRGRSQFLNQAVSAHELRRQKEWKSIFGKERYAMNMLLTILVLAGLLFGGRATVNAAQDDLPNEPLYGVKLWLEDLSLQFQGNEETRVNRLMELAQVRIQEMARLAEAGEPTPESVRQRLEQHLQQALRICADMDDPTLEKALLQIRNHLRDQDRDMEQLQLLTQGRLELQTQDQLRLQSQDQLQQQSQTRTMLQEHLFMVEEGLNNRELFRHQVQYGYQHGQNGEQTSPVQNGNTERQDQPETDPGGPNTEPGGTPNNSGGSGGDGSGGNGKP